MTYASSLNQIEKLKTYDLSLM